MKRFIMMVLMIICFSSNAQSETSGINLAIPNAGGSYGQDSIRTPDGLDCKNSIGGSTNLEFGVTGVIDNYQSPFGGNGADGFESSRDVGVYARITIPLDKPKQRINCNSLYELELRKKRLEVLKLQAELDALRKLNKSGGIEFETD